MKKLTIIGSAPYIWLAPTAKAADFSATRRVTRLIHYILINSYSRCAWATGRIQAEDAAAACRRYLCYVSQTLVLSVNHTCAKCHTHLCYVSKPIYRPL